MIGLLSDLLVNVVASVIVNGVFNVFFPSRRGWRMMGKVYVTGSVIRFSGGYEEKRIPGAIVYLRRGEEFPVGDDGKSTGWVMKEVDRGEVEESVYGCVGPLIILGVFCLVMYFIIWELPGLIATIP